MIAGHLISEEWAETLANLVRGATVKAGQKFRPALSAMGQDLALGK